MADLLTGLYETLGWSVFPWMLTIATFAVARRWVAYFVFCRLFG